MLSQYSNKSFLSIMADRSKFKNKQYKCGKFCQEDGTHPANTVKIS